MAAATTRGADASADTTAPTTDDPNGEPDSGSGPRARALDHLSSREAAGVGAVELTDASLRRWLHGLPGVDEVGAVARTAGLATRSIKTSAKERALELAVRMTDLTTLEGADTPGIVRSLCAKALRPDPSDPTCPSVAAVCIYSDLVPVAVDALGPNRTVKVAAVATAFPSGRASLHVKLADTRDAVQAGADEIDMVIDRGAFLAGRYGQVFEEIVAVHEVCRDVPAGRPPAHLKVIFETGELVTLDNVRRASWLAMLAGADFIKTSTGKVTPAATRPATLVMLQAVRDWFDLTNQVVGVKPAGGIRTAKEAIAYLVLVNETAGPRWLTPEHFRFGASSQLNDVLLQRRKIARGVYAGSDQLTVV
jgi:deoxyribose-phosphate aldolase